MVGENHLDWNEKKRYDAVLLMRLFSGIIVVGFIFALLIPFSRFYLITYLIIFLATSICIAMLFIFIIWFNDKFSTEEEFKEYLIEEYGWESIHEYDLNVGIAVLIGAVILGSILLLIIPYPFNYIVCTIVFVVGIMLYMYVRHLSKHEYDSLILKGVLSYRNIDMKLNTSPIIQFKELIEKRLNELGIEYGISEQVVRIWRKSVEFTIIGTEIKLKLFDSERDFRGSGYRLSISPVKDQYLHVIERLKKIIDTIELDHGDVD